MDTYILGEVKLHRLKYFHKMRYTHESPLRCNLFRCCYVEIWFLILLIEPSGIHELITILVSVTFKTKMYFLSLHVGCKFAVLLCSMPSMGSTLLKHADFGTDGKVQGSYETCNGC